MVLGNTYIATRKKTTYKYILELKDPNVHVTSLRYVLGSSRYTNLNALIHVVETMLYVKITKTFLTCLSCFRRVYKSSTSFIMTISLINNLAPVRKCLSPLTFL